MHKICYTLGLASAIMAASSCGKNDLRTATVVATDDITFEGCGYLLMLEEDGQLIKPSHLPGAYQHDGIVVELSYNHTGIVDTCEYSPKLFDLVNINEIHLKQD